MCFLSDIFKIGETAAEGRYCCTGNRGKELRNEKQQEIVIKYKSMNSELLWINRRGDFCGLMARY